MARIRTLKPEFWQDEKLAKCDALTRLVFLGLVSQADDTGRLIDSVKLIDGLLFPYTSESCADPLEVLDQLGVIQRGETASGQAVLQIVGWRHQKIDRPNLKGSLPTLTTIRRSLVEQSSNNRRSLDDNASNHTNDQRPTTIIPTTYSVATQLAQGAESFASPIGGEQKPTANPEPTFGDLMGMARKQGFEADATDASIIQALIRKHVKPGDIAIVLEGFPLLVKSGGYPVPAGQKLNMKMLYSSDHGKTMPAWRRAEDAFIAADNAKKPVGMGSFS